MEKKINSLADIKDISEPQNIDEAKMIINVMKKTFEETKDELQKTYKELATSREQANINFKKLLSMTQPVEKTDGQEVADADFSKINI